MHLVLIKYTMPKMSQRKTLSKPYACQKPSMDRNCCLIVFLSYICHTVIHRKLQNVVYMKKKLMLKKGGMGNQKHHRVLSTSTCDIEECLRPYAMCNIYILYYVYWWSLVNQISIFRQSW